MYYDKDHADNNTYIGAITARTEVWDGDFKFVCHMVDDNGNVDDSTSNSNDGTKKGAGEPNEVGGKVGQAQDFDGNEDYIIIADHASLQVDYITMEAVANCDNLTSDENIIRTVQGSGGSYLIRFDSTEFEAFVHDSEDTAIRVHGVALNSATWYHVAATYNGTTMYAYVDGSEYDDTAGTSVSMGSAATDNVQLGMHATSFYGGLIDEVRISSVARSAAWIKGTYNSLWDSLLTYGSEETEAVEVNAIFFGANF